MPILTLISAVLDALATQAVGVEKSREEKITSTHGEAKLLTPSPQPCSVL